MKHQFYARMDALDDAILREVAAPVRLVVTFTGNVSLEPRSTGLPDRSMATVAALAWLVWDLLIHLDVEVCIVLERFSLDCRYLPNFTSRYNIYGGTPTPQSSGVLTALILWACSRGITWPNVAYLFARYGTIAHMGYAC